MESASRLDVRSYPASWDPPARLAKRVFDGCIAGLGLILLAPLLFVIAFAICLESRGEAIYWQERRGRHGRPFRIAKFRTMHEGEESRRSELEHLNDADWPLFKIKTRDPRVTRVGRFLRSWSLDELPQLWNVVKGEMSIVGPRPLVLAEADALPALSDVRRDVRPGITGSWQVAGRHDLGTADMLRLDRDYVIHWSLARDFAILARTIRAVLTRRGAY